MTCIIPVLLLLVLALLLVGSLRGHKSRNLFPSGFASFLNQSHGVPQPNTTPATRVLLPPHSPPGDHSGPVQPRLSPTLSPRLSGPSPSVLVHAADQVPNVSQGLPGYLEPVAHVPLAAKPGHRWGRMKTHEVDDFAHPGTVHIGVHIGGHDDGVVAGLQGQAPLVAVEMGKVVGLPRIHTSPLSAEDQGRYWNRTAAALYAALEAAQHRLPAFHVAVGDIWAPDNPRWETAARLFPHRRRVHVNHHEAHAFEAFYTSPFQKALVVTVDGSGNDGNFNLFLAKRGDISMQRLYMKQTASYGVVYRYLAELPHTPHQGAFMAYAATGTPSDYWRPHVEKVFKVQAYTQQIAKARKLVRSVPNNESAAYAATVQDTLQRIILGRIRGKSEGALQTVDGIAISGGVAHNVCLNTRLQMDLQMPVHVPPNPGDGGVALGSLYKVERPAQPHDCRFLAPLLEDRARLDAYSAQWKARPTSAADVAQRLAKGHVGGLLRGQQEFGEIAFGHRSVLAVVTNATSKQRVLRYTGQQSYEYVQTVITAEHSRALFGKEWASPYASFAPKVADPLRCRNLTVCLRDGTVHLQTITPAADPWLHSLLGHVGAHTGCPCLMNVGLRRRGKPLMNRISEALQQLQEAQLDFVVVEGRVFDRI